MDWRAEWRVCARLVTSPGIGRFVLAGVRAPTGEQPGYIVSSNSGARSATSGAPRTGPQRGPPCRWQPGKPIKANREAK